MIKLPSLFSTRALACAAAGLAFFLAGCFEDKVAGGSSEVDNPIVVAFVDSLGVSVTTSGSLSIYLAGQNPALDPYPLLTKQLDNVSSIKLNASDFTQGLDTSRSYNLLLIADNDSVGALLQGLSYHPSKGRYTFDSVNVSKVKVPVVPLISYEASLNSSGGDTGLVRVFIPGSPFQSVVVDSNFVIEGVPRGSFAFHVLGGDGSERPLKDSPNNHGPGNHHEIDSSVPPIVRPDAPPPTQMLVVFAGSDVSILGAGGGGSTQFSLFGLIQGVDPADPRLAVLWRQTSSGSQNPKAVIDKPKSLNTRVSFPRAGAYQFILSAVIGTQRIEDTVFIAVQAPQPLTIFRSPLEWDTVFLWNSANSNTSFKVAWDADKKDTLWIDVSYDAGVNWMNITVFGWLESRPGPNGFDWYPTGPESANVRLRLRNLRNEIVATSERFELRNRPFNFMKTRSEEEEEVQGGVDLHLK